MPPLATRDIAGVLARHNYSELKKIGEGSFGKVLLVQSDADRSKLVCKIVDVSAASPKETQDAVKEGRLLASFKHPYIVRYAESFIDGGWLCLIMDYCEGGDLSKQIEIVKRKSQRISEEQILRWITQALLAIKYIHDKHVLHRDLKSGNFFLSGSGNLKMGDFGISCVLSCTIACAKTQIGTPYYLSPEVCMEKPYAWPSDIWAMGCVLYELCVLKVPFEASNISNLVQRICRGALPVIPAPYSDFLRQLCMDMLNRNAAARPSAEEILQRSRMQQMVRQMLEEVQSGHQQQQPPQQPYHAASGSCDSNGRPRPSNIGPSAPLAPIVGPYADTAGTYRPGDFVEYLSSTHRDWLLATVIEVDTEGRIVIDLKPNTWLSRHMQAQQVRPRRRPPPDQLAMGPVSPAVCATPMSQRSAFDNALRYENAFSPHFRRGSPLSNVPGSPGQSQVQVQAHMGPGSPGMPPLGQPATPLKRCGSRGRSPGFPVACGAVPGLVAPGAGHAGRYDGFRQNDARIVFGVPNAYSRQPPGLPRGAMNPMEMKMPPRPCKGAGLVIAGM